MAPPKRKEKKPRKVSEKSSAVDQILADLRRNLKVTRPTRIRRPRSTKEEEVVVARNLRNTSLARELKSIGLEKAGEAVGIAQELLKNKRVLYGDRNVVEAANAIARAIELYGERTGRSFPKNLTKLNRDHIAYIADAIESNGNITLRPVARKARVARTKQLPPGMIELYAVHVMAFPDTDLPTKRRYGTFRVLTKDRLETKGNYDNVLAYLKRGGAAVVQERTAKGWKTLKGNTRHILPYREAEGLYFASTSQKVMVRKTKEMSI